MSVESKIIAAVAFSGYPCYRRIYTGTATTYFVMTIDSEPTDFADNAPRHERFSAMLHFVAPITFDDTTLRKQIKDALKAAGFTYPTAMDASDEKQLRVIYEFKIAEVV